MNDHGKDLQFVFNLVLYIFMGSVWISISSVILPVGFILGLILIHFEKFVINRKFEYIMLVLGVYFSFINLHAIVIAI